MKLWRENIFIMKRNHALAHGFDVFVTFYELYVSTVYLFSKSHLSCRVISPRSIWVYLFGRQNCLKANKLKHSYLCLLLDWHKLRKDFTFDRIFKTISDKLGTARTSIWYIKYFTYMRFKEMLFNYVINIILTY